MLLIVLELLKSTWIQDNSSVTNYSRRGREEKGLRGRLKVICIVNKLLLKMQFLPCANSNQCIQKKGVQKKHKNDQLTPQLLLILILKIDNYYSLDVYHSYYQNATKTFINWVPAAGFTLDQTLSLVLCTPHIHRHIAVSVDNSPEFI